VRHAEVEPELHSATRSRWLRPGRLTGSFEVLGPGRTGTGPSTAIGATTTSAEPVRGREQVDGVSFAVAEIACDGAVRPPILVWGDVLDGRPPLEHADSLRLRCCFYAVRIRGGADSNGPENTAEGVQCRTL
jgi:hypothetical protein